MFPQPVPGIKRVQALAGYIIPRILVLIALGWLPLVTLGQGIYYHDFELWHEVDARYDPNKHLTLQASYVCRNYGFDQGFKGSYYYAQARQKLDKHFYVDAQVRIADSHTRSLFRGEVGIMYRMKLGKDQLTARVAYFNERDHLMPEAHLQQPADNYLRARIRYRLDLPNKFQGYASAEIWDRFGRKGIVLKRWALIGGLDRAVFPRVHMFLEYMMQQEFDTVGPVLLQAVNIGAGYNFTKRRYTRGKRGNNGLKDD